MKNTIKTIIVIATLSIIGCNNSAPIESMDADECKIELLKCTESEDYAWDEVDACEKRTVIIETVTDTAKSTVPDTMAVIDNPTPLETCEIQRASWENETYRVGESLDLCVAKLDGLHSRYDEVFYALQSVPIDIASKLCDLGAWDAWICESLGY